MLGKSILAFSFVDGIVSPASRVAHEESVNDIAMIRGLSKNDFMGALIIFNLINML
jgi:hypothetical protein